MDTEKQRQRRRNDARLTESGNAKSEQLNTRSAYRVANQQSLACLSGSERQRPGWFLDMKYQTCCSRLSVLRCTSRRLLWPLELFFDQTVCELALELMISQVKFQGIFCLVSNITTSHLKHYYGKTMLTITRQQLSVRMYVHSSSRYRGW